MVAFDIVIIHIGTAREETEGDVFISATALYSRSRQFYASGIVHSPACFLLFRRGAVFAGYRTGYVFGKIPVHRRSVGTGFADIFSIYYIG